MTACGLPPETEWRHWSVLPTIVGAYKREWWPGCTYYAWWTGCGWGRLATTPELARRYAMDGEMSTHRKLRWCGLSADPRPRPAIPVHVLSRAWRS